MKTPTAHEIQAMSDAGMEGGKYLDNLGVSDVGALSFDQWNEFVQTICVAFCDSMRLRAGLIMMDMGLSEYRM